MGIDQLVRRVKNAFVRFVRVPASCEFRRRMWLSCLVLVAALVMSSRSAVGQEYQASEYDVKAAFLYYFPKFIEWPAAAYSDPNAPNTLCILGRDPFGRALDRIIAQGTANGRPLLIRRIQRNDPIPNCQVLYISPSEGKNVGQIVKSLHRPGVLTIGETDQFAAQGGVIQLVLEDKQVRLVINVSAASREGLKISSKLLALAQIVSDP